MGKGNISNGRRYNVEFGCLYKPILALYVKIIHPYKEG